MGIFTFLFRQNPIHSSFNSTRKNPQTKSKLKIIWPPIFLPLLFFCFFLSFFCTYKVANLIQIFSYFTCLLWQLRHWNELLAVSNEEDRTLVGEFNVHVQQQIPSSSFIIFFFLHKSSNTINAFLKRMENLRKIVSDSLG